MRKLLLPALAAGLFLPVVLLAACGDDDEDATTFDLALTIEGTGDVTSTPTGLLCTGPKDCGKHAFAAGTVTLRATPGAGQALVGWKVDDVAREASATASLDVVGAAGGTPKVIAIFAAGGGGGAGGGDGGTTSADAGPDSGSDGGTEARACASNADCADESTVCCVEATSPPAPLRASYTVESVTCRPATACVSAGTTIRGQACQAPTTDLAPACPRGEFCAPVRDDGLGVCSVGT